MRLPTKTATPNANLVERSGLNYVNIPVDKAELSAEQIAAFDGVIRQSDGPYLLHCATGIRAAILPGSICTVKSRGWCEAALKMCALTAMPRSATFLISAIWSGSNSDLRKPTMTGSSLRARPVARPAVDGFFVLGTGRVACRGRRPPLRRRQST